MNDTIKCRETEVNQHSGTPPAEFDVTEGLVQRLLASQHLDLADLPLRFIDSGFDNVIYRLGDDLCLRMPRRAVAAELVLNEQTWLPQLQAKLPLALPAPVRIGVPGEDYPWHWSVLPWFEGETANNQSPAPEEAKTWGAFLAALHVRAPLDAPSNPFRGCPLAERQSAVEERMMLLEREGDAITGGVKACWSEGLAARPSAESIWLHGDLHGRNILVEDGCFSAVLDWGDITSGDRAIDLASFWMLFDDEWAREEGLRTAGAHDDALLARARGWAVSFGVLLLATGRVDNPAHEKMGQDILRRLSEERGL